MKLLFPLNDLVLGRFFDFYKNYWTIRRKMVGMSIC